MDGCEVSYVNGKIKSSLFGKNVKIISSIDNNEKRFIIGEQSHIELNK